MRGVSSVRWIGAALAAAFLALYAWTLAPGVPPTDGGELALAAWLPGVAHAPGFPLYVLVGWLWSHLLPLGAVAWRLNLLSAACGAAAVGLTVALAQASWRADAPALRATRAGNAVLVAAGVTGALALGLGRTAWSWAITGEVYALNLALAAAILALVLRATQERMKSQLPGFETVAGRVNDTSTRPRSQVRTRKNSFPAQSTRHAPRNTQYAIRNSAKPPSGTQPIPLLLAAFLFGLGLGGHLTSTALLAPALAYWLTARCGWRFWRSRTAGLAALALLTGAAVYLYLPLRAAADPLLNWGQPDTAQRFVWHITAKQYRVSLLSAPVWPQVLLAGQLWWTQFTPLGLALIGLGVWRMARRDRTLCITLALIVVCITLYAWTYVIEDDGDAYYLPAFLAGAVWVAWGAREALAWIGSRFRTDVPAPGAAANRNIGPVIRRSSSVRIFRAALLPLLVAAVALAFNWSACDRRGDTIPEDYVRDTFAEIGPGGLLLTRDWQLYSPALYLQQVEGLRSDITVIDTELLRRGWYAGLLHRVDPGLLAAVSAEEAAFLALRDAWERGAIPDGDPRLGQLQAAYVALLDAFVRAAEADGRPVHVGPNRGAEPLRAATLRGQPDMEAGSGRAWRWLPVGLTFRAAAAAAAAAATGPVAPLPPLAWRTAPFSRVALTPPERKIQASRADMAVLRGLARANAGDLVGAQADWQIALAVDPAHAPALELLARLRGGK